MNYCGVPLLCMVGESRNGYVSELMWLTVIGGNALVFTALLFWLI